MKKISQIIARTVFSIALAGAVAAAASGCGQTQTSGTAGSETSPAAGISSEGTQIASPEGSTGNQAIADSADQFSSAIGSTSDFSEDLLAVPQETSDTSDTGATSAAPADSTSAVADEDLLGTPANTNPTAASTASTDAGTAGTGAETATVPGTDYVLPAQPAGAVQSSGERTAAAAIQDGVPERTGEDTVLKESVLSKALVEGTGWGQSAGSSLRAATAATRILEWSNLAGAGDADSGTLSEAVKTEYDRLTQEQRENLKNNWSFISYDVETMLDSFSDMEGVLTDAGCLESARAAVADKNVLSNWKAFHDAIEAAMK